MTTLDMIIGLLLLTAIFGWLLKRHRYFIASGSSKITRPLTPNIPVLKQLIYAWWLITGLWLEKIDTVLSSESPFHQRVSIWVHQFALVLISGVFLAVLYELVSR